MTRTNLSGGRRLGRPLLALLALLAMASVSGCVGYRSISGDAVAAPADVRIRLTPPTSVVVRSPEQDSTTLTRVVELYGRVIERDPAVVTLEVSRARALSLDGRLTITRFASGAVARVPTQDVAVRETRVVQTVLLVLGVVALAALIVGSASPDPQPPSEKEPKESTA